MQEKRRCMIFEHFWFPLPISFPEAAILPVDKATRTLGTRLFLCRFASCLYTCLYCNYPLTTTQGDRFASCENIVSGPRPRLFRAPLAPPRPLAKTGLCLLNHTVQKDSREVLGTSFRFDSRKHPIWRLNRGENWQPKEPFYRQRSVIYGIVDEVCVYCEFWSVLGPV